MIGLMILLFFGVYLALSIWAIKATVSWAKRNSRSPWRWGGLAAFVMYNLVFWDFIPTLVAHKYYCSTQAGFWVYKTPEQWVAENPKMKDKVTYQEKITSDYKEEKIENGIVTLGTVNQRTPIKLVSKIVKPFPILRFRKKEEVLLDSNSNFVLTRYLTYSAGLASGAPNSVLDFIRMNIPECEGQHGNAQKSIYVDAVASFVDLGETND